MTGIEAIRNGSQLLAYVISSDATSSETDFFTLNEANFQAGFVVYGAGGAVVPHAHLPVERRVVGTSELLVVRSGRCYVDFYSDRRELVTSRELSEGDAVLSLAGGHGFRMVEPTVLL